MKSIFKYFIILVFLFSLFFIFPKDVSAQGHCFCKVGLTTEPLGCGINDRCSPGYTADDTCNPTLIEPKLYSCDGTCTCVSTSPCATQGQACATDSNCCQTAGTLICGPTGICIQPGFCTPGATLPCGNCGTQTCLADGSDYGPCQNEGPCSPGQTQTCSGSYAQTCGTNCQWGSCSCGNGVCDSGEGCGSCTVDCGPCPNCGNNKIDSGEICDGTDLNGQTCQSQGFSSGVLGCKSDCSGFDTLGCGSGGGDAKCIDDAFIGHGNSGDRPWNTRWDGQTNLPSKLTLAAGQNYSFTFSMLNRDYSSFGNTSWRAGSYMLVPLSAQFTIRCNTDAGRTKGYCNIGGEIMPGTDWLGYNINYFGKVNITAPSTPGTYSFQMRMVHLKSQPYNVPILKTSPVQYKTCGAPSTDTYFGETLTSTVTVVPVNNPKGFHDNSNCAVSSGWACDADNYNSPQKVYFYKDGPVGTGSFIGTTTANQAREPAVAAQCGGNANHGFTFPTPNSLTDTSTHTIYAYSNNTGSGSDVLLSGSPKTIGPCCTNTVRDCKTITFQQFKEIHRKYYKWKDTSNPAYVEAILNQTNQITGTYYSCQPKAIDIACCTNISTCVFRGKCYADGELIGDIDGDFIQERCLAHSPGQWIDNFEIDCSNGIDDDNDGSIDCNDPDCDGSLNGTVKNQNNQAISSANTQLKWDITPFASTTTNNQGTYSFPVVICGTYNLGASHPNYAPQLKSVTIQGREDTFANFTLIPGTSCEQDCTFAFDNIVHASCDGKNGCTFYDNIAKAACDNSQPGWVRDYNASHYVVCAPGSPQPKVDIQASITCSSGTLVKITRIILYNGKPVRLVVATCG